MATDTQLISDLPVPPGEYLQEVVDELGVTQADLARRMGRPAQAINEIIKGEKAITPETALQLEQVDFNTGLSDNDFVVPVVGQ